MSGRLLSSATIACCLCGSWSTVAAACPDWRQTGQVLDYSSEEVWTPQSHEVIAGGSADLATCPMPGTGYVATPPDFTLSYADEGRGRDLEFRVEAGCDSVLLVNDPATGWHYNDDDGGIDPRIRLRAAEEGVYDLWVGTLGAATCPAELVIESFDGTTAAPPEASGTAFLVNRDGWILTNAHVIEGCAEVEVSGHGQATRIVRDDEEDLAALRLERAPDVAPLAFRSRPARLAEAVHAIGFPLSGILSPAVRVTSGTVNSLSGFGQEQNFIQISAPIQPGNSGGPVIDGAGLVIGVTTATLSESAYGRAQNVNFALPSAAAVQFLARNGIDHETGDASAAPAGDISDRVEIAAAATVMVECSPAEADGGAPIPLQPETGMVVEPGIDVIGFDYDTVRDVSLDACRAACEREGRCRAFTFNRRHQACFLKEDAALLAQNDDAVGGYARSLSGSVLSSGFRIRTGADTPGGDYAQLRDSEFAPCFLECAADSRCRAFAFVTRTRDCWLKDTVGPVLSLPGVELGLR